MLPSGCVTRCVTRCVTGRATEPLRSSSPCPFEFAETLDRFPRTDLVQFIQLPHFDFAAFALAHRRWKTARPFPCFFARARVDQGVARNQFAGLGKRPIDDGSPAALIAHAPTPGAWLQTARVEQHARFREFFVIG